MAKGMRADARRNREKLVAVAAAAFAEHGVNTSLEEIARRAGVGIGTLYRHFPTREHLVEVVYRREVDLLCKAAEDLAHRLPPEAALAEWMQLLVGYAATKRGMADSLRILFDQNCDVFAESPNRIAGALERLLAAAAKAGTIRGDVAASDVLQALSGIYSAPDTPDWQARSRRIMSLIMDGLRWSAPKGGGQG
jgi:AcrR family transcriptional regulator